MKQAIAGVAPPELSEVTIMTVWPSVGGTPLGRALGRLFMIRAGFWHIFTVGNLLALAAIPLAIPLYFVKFAPWDCRRFRLTNRRVIIEKGLQAAAERSLPLDQFDAVDVNILPGQAWYPCGVGVPQRQGRDAALERRLASRDVPPHLSQGPAFARRRAAGVGSRSS